MTRTYEEFPEVAGWDRCEHALGRKSVKYTYKLRNGVLKTLCFFIDNGPDYICYTEVISHLRLPTEDVCGLTNYWRRDADFETFFQNVVECLDARVMLHLKRIKEAGYV